MKVVNIDYNDIKKLQGKVSEKVDNDECFQKKVI